MGTGVLFTRKYVYRFSQVVCLHAISSSVKWASATGVAKSQYHEEESRIVIGVQNARCNAVQGIV